VGRVIWKQFYFQLFQESGSFAWFLSRSIVGSDDSFDFVSWFFG